jgi:hypothetical protein
VTEFLVFHFVIQLTFRFSGVYFDDVGVTIHDETSDSPEEEEIVLWTVLISDSLTSVM